MGEMWREGPALVARSIAGTFVFTGRSRRLEVAYYWLFSMVAGALSQISVGALLEGDHELISREAISLLLTLPCFALFVRRLHDQGLSGWWVLIMPPMLALDLYQTMRASFHAFDPGWAELGNWPLLLLPAAIFLLGICVIPGDIGRNEYGGDPRLEPEQPAPAGASDLC